MPAIREPATTNARATAGTPKTAKPASKPAVKTPAKPPVKNAAKPKADGFEGTTTKPQAKAKADVAATTTISPKTAKPVDPLDTLKLVKNGDLNLTLPLRAGKLPGGILTAKEGTVMSFTGKITNGNIDMSKLKIAFDPPLDGPAWTGVRGGRMDDNRIRLDLQGLPDPKFGPALPTKLADFASALQGVAKERKVDVQLFGIPLGKFGPGPKKPGTGSTPSTGPSTGEKVAGAVMQATDLEQARISVKNAEFAGDIQLGNAGSLKVKPGTKFTLEGGINDLTLKGHANLTGLTLNTPSTQLKGGAGSADINVRYVRGQDNKAAVITAIDNLNVETKSAQSKRSNGDYVSLAKGKIENAQVRIEETLTHGADGFSVKGVEHSVDRVKIGKFNGTLDGARLTMKDQKDDAQLTLSKSQLAGSVDFSAEKLAFSGDLDVNAKIKDFQGGKGPASIDLKQADISGKGKVTFDSTQGVSLSGGDLEFKAKLNKSGLNGKLPIIGLPAEASVGKGSTVKFKAEDLNFSTIGGLKVSGGKPSVDVDLKGGRVEVGGVELWGDDDKKKPAKPSSPSASAKPPKTPAGAKPPKPGSLEAELAKAQADFEAQLNASGGKAPAHATPVAGSEEEELARLEAELMDQLESLEDPSGSPSELDLNGDAAVEAGHGHGHDHHDHVGGAGWEASELDVEGNAALGLDGQGAVDDGHDHAGHDHSVEGDDHAGHDHSVDEDELWNKGDEVDLTGGAGVTANTAGDVQMNAFLAERNLLKRGAKGAQVRELQEKLTAAGFGPLKLDGDFGPATMKAVRAFQESRGLQVDGVVGQQTWASLFFDAKVSPGSDLLGKKAAS